MYEEFKKSVPYANYAIPIMKSCFAGIGALVGYGLYNSPVTACLGAIAGDIAGEIVVNKSLEAP